MGKLLKIQCAQFLIFCFKESHGDWFAVGHNSDLAEELNKKFKVREAWSGRLFVCFDLCGQLIVCLFWPIRWRESQLWWWLPRRANFSLMRGMSRFDVAQINIFAFADGYICNCREIHFQIYLFPRWKHWMVFFRWPPWSRLKQLVLGRRWQTNPKCTKNHLKFSFGFFDTPALVFVRRWTKDKRLCYVSHRSQIKIRKKKTCETEESLPRSTAFL